MLILRNFFNYYPLDVVRDTDTFKTFYNATSNDVSFNVQTCMILYKRSV